MIKKILIFLSAINYLFSLDLGVGIIYQQANYVFNTNTTSALYDEVSNEIYENNIVAPVFELSQDLKFGRISLGLSYEYGYKNEVETFDALPTYLSGTLYLLPIDIKPYIHGSFENVFYLNEKNIDMSEGRGIKVGVGLVIEGVYAEVGMKNTNAKRNGADMVYGGFYFQVKAGPEALVILN